MPTYTTLEQVKSKLTSTRGDRVRFSQESLVNVTVKSQLSSRKFTENTDLIFVYDDIVFSSSFSRSMNLVIKFDNGNNTDYSIYEQYLRTDRREMKIGTSDTSSNLSLFGGDVQIPASCWSGAIAENDQVELEIDTHISEDLAEDYIDETEDEIDNMLIQAGIGYQISDGKLFTALDVPNLIATATTYLAAYYIYTDIFYDKMREKSKDGYTSFADRWKKRAEKLVTSYAKANLVYSTPVVISFPSEITKFGVKGVPEWDTTQEGATDDYTTLPEDEDKSQLIWRGEDYIGD